MTSGYMKFKLLFSLFSDIVSTKLLKNDYARIKR